MRALVRLPCRRAGRGSDGAYLGGRWPALKKNRANPASRTQFQFMGHLPTARGTGQTEDMAARWTCADACSVSAEACNDAARCARSATRVSHEKRWVVWNGAWSAARCVALSNQVAPSRPRSGPAAEGPTRGAASAGSCCAQAPAWRPSARGNASSPGTRQRCCRPGRPAAIW